MRTGEELENKDLSRSSFLCIEFQGSLVAIAGQGGREGATEMAALQSRIGSPCALSPGLGFVPAWKNQKKSISLCKLRDSNSALCLRRAIAAQPSQRWSNEIQMSGSLVEGAEIPSTASQAVERRAQVFLHPNTIEVAGSRAKWRSGMTRRLCIALPLIAFTSSSVGVSRAAVKELSLGNSFLRSLGIGDPDIYYPQFFEGTWNCFSTLVAVETPQGEDKADRKSVEFSRKQLGYTVEYKARFVPFKDNIIGDRLFTTSSLVQSTVGKDVIRDASWNPDKPNRLTLSLRGGVKVENLVTKRSAEATGAGQFDTSEFSKQVFDNSAIKDGPPSVKASQNLTRYRWDPIEDPVATIEAFQRVAMFPLPREGMDLSDVMGMDKPVTIYKYVVRFTRQKES